MMLTAGLALLLSCTKPDRNSLPRYMREQGRFSEYASAGKPQEEAENGPSLYLTAVSNGEILLFRDGRIVARAPAGDSPERHRARGGHLYSDAIEGHETVLFKDGEELFRYAGEEVIVGFCILDGDIYTLGQRAGRGFSYRINGKEIYSDPAGRIVGSNMLTEWDGGAFSGGLYYAYCISLGKSSCEYHVMKGAETVRLFETLSSESVLDIRVLGDEIYIAKRLDGGKLEFVRSDESITIGKTEGEIPSGMWIVPYSRGACVKWCSRGRVEDTFWVNSFSGLLDFCPAMSGGVIPDMLLGGHYVTVKDGKVNRIYTGHRMIPMEENRYTFTSPLCAALIGGQYHVALSDADSGSHLVIAGRSERQEWHFPGYFTSIRRE